MNRKRVRSHDWRPAHRVLCADEQARRLPESRQRRMPALLGNHVFERRVWLQVTILFADLHAYLDNMVRLLWLILNVV